MRSGAVCRTASGSHDACHDPRPRLGDTPAPERRGSRGAILVRLFVTAMVVRVMCHLATVRALSPPTTFAGERTVRDGEDRGGRRSALELMSGR